MKYSQWIPWLSLGLATLLTGCGGSSSNGGEDTPPSSKERNLAVLTVIDQETGFLNLGSFEDSTIDNSEGIEVSAYCDYAIHGDYLYIFENRTGDKLFRYRKEGNNLVKIGEMNLGENSIAARINFVSATKAYVPLTGRGELLVINPDTMTEIKRIDLATYAPKNDANRTYPAYDGNPDPADGIIRGDRYYLALRQFDEATYDCQGDGHILVFNTANDEVVNNISDDRLCTIGTSFLRDTFFTDEQNNIYVNGFGAWGYHGPSRGAGLVRINQGSDDFDPDYFFDVKTPDLSSQGIEGGHVAYIYGPSYVGGDKAYTYMLVPALTSSPPDYVNDRNYQPFALDLIQKTITKLPIPATTGWSGGIYPHRDGKVLFTLSPKEGGDGLYWYDPTLNRVDTTPSIKTVGTPSYIRVFE